MCSMHLAPPPALGELLLRTQRLTVWLFPQESVLATSCSARAHLQIIHKLLDFQFGFVHPCDVFKADSLPRLAVHNRETSHFKLILGRRNIRAGQCAPEQSREVEQLGAGSACASPCPCPPSARKRQPTPRHSFRQTEIKVTFQTFKEKCLFYIISSKKAV